MSMKIENGAASLAGVLGRSRDADAFAGEVDGAREGLSFPARRSVEVAVDRPNEGVFYNRTYGADDHGVRVWVLRDQYEGGGQDGKSVGIIGTSLDPSRTTPGYGDAVLLDTNDNGIPDKGDTVFKVPNQYFPTDHWVVEGQLTGGGLPVRESVKPGNARTAAIMAAAEAKNEPLRQNYGSMSVERFQQLMGPDKPIIIDGRPIAERPSPFE